MDEPTPGSWGMTKSENGEFYLDEWYVSADGVDGMVAIVNGEANARRVAAAPEMLEALKAMYNFHCANSCQGPIHSFARAAIAKATGLTE